MISTQKNRLEFIHNKIEDCTNDELPNNPIDWYTKKKIEKEDFINRSSKPNNIDKIDKFDKFIMDSILKQDEKNNLIYDAELSDLDHNQSYQSESELVYKK